MITDVITIEMVRDTISTLYRIGNTVFSEKERKALAMAIAALEAEVERCEELEQFTNEEIAKVEAYHNGN